MVDTTYYCRYNLNILNIRDFPSPGQNDRVGPVPRQLPANKTLVPAWGSKLCAGIPPGSQVPAQSQPGPGLAGPGVHSWPGADLWLLSISYLLPCVFDHRKAAFFRQGKSATTSSISNQQRHMQYHTLIIRLRQHAKYQPHHLHNHSETTMLLCC